ncbi:peptidase S8/S53 domain-containing protein [Mycena polygramma]|nr:peptidase S8/S53 domain-containing protein [Mycena polygramma]
MASGHSTLRLSRTWDKNTSIWDLDGGEPQSEDTHEDTVLLSLSVYRFLGAQRLQLPPAASWNVVPIPSNFANLDIQYSMAMSFPTPNIYYSTGGSPPFKADTATTTKPYLDWLNFILNQTTIPQTLTTSYGGDEQTVPQDYATSVCNLFAQLGARGSSIMFSSGDGGVGAGDCRANDDTNRTIFQPAFPASTVSGTSASSPVRLAQTYEVIHGNEKPVQTFAAVIALLNDFRISEGKPALGFLNPLIYSTAKAGFNDIVSGSNPGCGQDGFTATPGWDPVTGLGTPDFMRLHSLI